MPSSIGSRPCVPLRLALAGVVALTSLAACGRARFIQQDADVRDALALDAAPGDDAIVALVPDAAVPPADPDAWAADARTLDAWTTDALAPDARSFDAWATDAWTADAWAADARPLDAFVTDAFTEPMGDLVGHYVFSGDGSDGTGGTDLDCSSCTFFDGGMIASSNIAVPDRPELATGDYSFAAWVMVRSSQPLGTGMGVLTSMDFSFEVDRNSDGTGGVTVYLPRTGSSGRAVPLDTWLHLAVTWNEASSRVRTWLNAVVLDDRVLGYRPASTGLTIWAGLPIDDLVLYDRELSMAELEALAATRR